MIRHLLQGLVLASLARSHLAQFTRPLLPPDLPDPTSPTRPNGTEPMPIPPNSTRPIPPMPNGTEPEPEPCPQIMREALSRTRADIFYDCANSAGPKFSNAGDESLDYWYYGVWEYYCADSSNSTMVLHKYHKHTYDHCRGDGDCRSTCNTTCSSGKCKPVDKNTCDWVVGVVEMYPFDLSQACSIPIAMPSLPAPPGTEPAPSPWPERPSPPMPNGTEPEPEPEPCPQIMREALSRTRADIFYDCEHSAGPKFSNVGDESLDYWYYGVWEYYCADSSNSTMVLHEYHKHTYDHCRSDRDCRSACNTTCSNSGMCKPVEQSTCDWVVGVVEMYPFDLSQACSIPIAMPSLPGPPNTAPAPSPWPERPPINHAPSPNSGDDRAGDTCVSVPRELATRFKGRPCSPM